LGTPDDNGFAPGSTREVTNRDLIGRIAKGLWHGARRRQSEFRYGLARELWFSTKRFAVGDEVRNLEIAEIPAVRDAVVTAYPDDRNRAVLAALCQGLGAKTFFEIGTNRGRTALSVARSNPDLDVYTLDLPSPEAGGETELDLTEADKRLFTDWRRGEAFEDTPEAERITQLLGDSASYDFSEYEGKMDVVFIDGSHSYPYVTNDTRVAEEMLTANGTIVWDDYPGFPGVLQCVLESARRLDGPVFHILGTRMAVYSRAGLELELAGDEERGRVRVA
jgi:predicted O-methyltransferase YrrM